MNGLESRALTLATCLGLFFSAAVQGAVSLSGTRLVFDGEYAETSIQASNVGQQTVLLQAWLSKEGGDGTHAQDLPFVVTPHLAQLPPGGKQTLRLLYQGVGMPVDSESLLHLYVMGIPRRSEAAQQLSIAVRQRINVFYRPKGLLGDPAEAAQNLSWRLSSQTLQVSNPTPFHVSLQHLTIDGAELSDYLLIKPKSTASVPLNAPPNQETSGHGLSFKALTDYGGQRDYCATLQRTGSFTARLVPSVSDSFIRKC